MNPLPQTDEPLSLMFITYQGDMAGSTNSIFYLSTTLAAMGHTVTVGCRQESLLYKRISDTNTTVIPVAMTFKSRTSLENMRQIRDAVKKYNIQLINAQSSYDRYTTILANWLFKLGIAVVLTRRQPPHSIGGWLQNTFYTRGSSGIVTVSQSLKNTFVEMGIAEKHLHVINNGIPQSFYNYADPEQTQQYKKQLGIKSEDVVVGCVCRTKKQAQLVKALPLLSDNVKLVFAGVPVGWLDNVADEHQVDKSRLIYAGKLPVEKLASLYALFDAKVLCSTTEGFGLVLVEAMGMGIPVVGTRATGIIDVIGPNEERGFLYENENPSELAEKIKQALATNAAYRQKIKKAARNEFSMEQTARNYEKLFRQFINKG